MKGRTELERRTGRLAIRRRPYASAPWLRPPGARRVRTADAFCGSILPPAYGPAGSSCVSPRRRPVRSHRYTHPSCPAVTRLRPSPLKPTDTCRPAGPVNTSSGRSVAPSHTMVDRSSLVLANVRPSVDHVTVSTAPVCWRARPRWVALAMSQTATSEPVATSRVAPSGLTVRPRGTGTRRCTAPLRPSASTVSDCPPRTVVRPSDATVIVRTAPGSGSTRTSWRRDTLHTSTEPELPVRIATESPSARIRPVSGVIGPNGAPTGAPESRFHSTVPGLPEEARSPKASSPRPSAVNATS